MRLTHSLAAAATALLVVVPASSAVAPTRDSVKGEGETAIATKFHLNGTSAADGSDARGVAKLKNKQESTLRQGRIVCLRVQGNEAIIGIELHKADPSDPADFRTLAARDNGAPPKGNKPGVDQLQQVSSSDTPPTCTDALPADMGAPIAKGDITIVDVP